MNDKKAVILVSGGMDSAVVCGFAEKKYDLAFLHINYGQRTEKRELTSFQSLADFYKVKERLTVDLHHFKTIGGSSLTDSKIEVPKGLSEEEIPSTYVPFRNAQLLSVAISWAEVIGASAVFSGATEEDAAGYPDCRKEFYDVFNSLVDVGTKDETKIEVLTPLIFMKKGAIVKLGNELGVPFERTWSCYQNNEVACGRCDSCLRRLRAFSEAGVKDPIPYEKT
jgi:7-cyano-7-deazaguanine synthase